jgi:hypothetical protein
MALVADLYGMSINEAMALSPRETLYLLDKAQLTFYQLATTSTEMQSIMRQRLSPTLKGVREARKVREVGGGTQQPSGDRGGIGEPPEI